MAWAVHRLDTETLLFNLEKEQVLLILIIVTGSLPELQVENVGRNNFLEASNAVLLTDQIHKLVVDVGAVRVEERAAWGQFMDIKQLLLLAN